jgi:SAM-dependent methyltransferase
MLRIDLGCGPSKAPGFLGVDRFPLEGVDMVADLNKSLPFADNSVDLVYASHSLEHIQDLMFTMSEVYRICKHRAQICIVAPYNEQKLNVANPYHYQVFNEHTSRFWTTHPLTEVDPADYYHPHAGPWGLAASDHSESVIDIRTNRIEFFYFPQYELLSAEIQREFRNQRWDVCDQIMYHLSVWKEHLISDLNCVAPEQEFFKPPYVVQRNAALEERRQIQSNAGKTPPARLE